ncbi:MAG: amidase [Actinobacteria bacterium]|nr:amidase [Actinomycetota bacterium]
MDLTQQTATQLIDLYRTGDASPVEALQQVLDRLERLEPTLNAFVMVDANAGMASARQSEERWADYRSGGAPVGDLEGVPVSIKDILLTKGWPTLRGSRAIDPSQPWDVDAPCVARIREAGGVMFGKTTTPEFGCKAETNSPLRGETRNPWDASKTPGGSSGGTAAAVAAGIGPLSVGTDGAGSVRIPAAFCGNVGLKPSFGRIPAYPLSPFGTVAHLGPHCMSVADCALLMNVLARPDPRDWMSLPYDGVDYLTDLDGGIRGLRIAYSPDLGYATVDPEVSALVASAVRELEALGAAVEQVDPGFDDPLDISTGLWFVSSKTVYDSLGPAGQAMTDPDFASQAEQGAAFTAQDIQLLSLKRNVLGTLMRDFMTRYDLLVTPAVAVPAFDSRPAGAVPMTPETMLSWTPFSYPFNLTQQPAITIPCGLTSAGLPVGLQFVGPAHGDALVIRAARAYETVRPVARPTM